MDWLPIIVTVLGIFGGAFVYRWQKRVDRETKALDERREAYRKYIEVSLKIETHIFDTEGDTDNQDVTNYQIALANLQLIAPERVVNSASRHQEKLQTAQDLLTEIRENGGDIGEDENLLFNELQKREELMNSEILEALEDLIYEMRGDNFLNANLSDRPPIQLLRLRAKPIPSPE